MTRAAGRARRPWAVLLHLNLIYSVIGTFLDPLAWRTLVLPDLLLN